MVRIAKVRSAVLLGAALMCLVCNVRAQQAPGGFKLPPMNFSQNPNYYPSSALKRSVQGRVLLDFTITRRGKIDGVTIIDSAPESMFDSAAKKALGDIVFTVPGDWESSGATLHHFTLSFVFKIYPCPTNPCFDLQPHTNADDFFIVTAQAKQ